MAFAEACANIALVKYWGKREPSLNLPTAGSLSLTLERLRTETEVELHDGAQDEVYLNGAPADSNTAARVSRFVDIVRNELGSSSRVRVASENRFPTASGLASSASAFAALAAATCHAFGWRLSESQLSSLARRGSGSAARSVFGGFVRMNPGTLDDGSDAFAEPVKSQLQLSAAIATVTTGPKDVGSTQGMDHTRATSPYDAPWYLLVPLDLARCEAALRAGDFREVANVAEGNCLAMHANAMAARPGLVYWQPATVALIHTVRRLRKDGLPVFFTIDAGPHVVAFCESDGLNTVVTALSQVPGVQDVLTSGPGPGVRVRDRR
ncbi:MAG: diphosphomevalonate decarboxylase [Myxococcota bacterium]